MSGLAASQGAPALPLLHLLRCAGCRSSELVDHGTSLECGACGRFFPVQADVPVMLRDVVAARGPLLDPVAAGALMDRLGLAPDPIGVLRVRKASGARVRSSTAEGERLAHDGRVLAGLVAPPACPRPADGVGDLRCEWQGDYLPRAMRPGGELLANVRFRNAGSATMPSAGGGRVTVACQWAWASGGGVADEDIRTPLPADLAPGQVLTLPVRLRPPAEPGRYTLTLRLVQEGVRWLEPGYGPVCIDLHDGVGFTPPADWVLDGPGPHDPEGDRARALALMRQWMAHHAPPRPRVLELGGGASPAVAQPGYDAYVVDGDLLALQLGRLVPRPPVHPVCADLADLPIAERAFDAIVCFGTLRYEADPARTLRNLRGHLRPGGFIGLFCEPVGQMWPGAPSQAALADLRRGLNPQGFSPAEYAEIFRNARLRVAELVVDGASLKARLEPEAADA